MIALRHIPARGGFTLLELLLAVTVLASITALVAVTWAQMNDWVADSGEEHHMMRLHRALRLMTDQWEDRRTTAPMGENNARFASQETVLGFVTATPILFPEWPVVRAEYRIRPTPDRRPGDPRTWDLVYTEHRIVEFGPATDEDRERTMDAWGNELRRSLDLLEACTELRFERFGLAADIRAEAAAPTPPSDPDASGGGDQEPAPDAEDEQAPERIDPMDSNAIDAAREAGIDETIIRAAVEMRWRAHGNYSGFTPAVRLVGQFEEREFTCVFADKALH